MCNVAVCVLCSINRKLKKLCFSRLPTEPKFLWPTQMFDLNLCYYSNEDTYWGLSVIGNNKQAAKMLSGGM